MTAKEMFYKLGFDLKEDTNDKKIYVRKTGDFNEVIVFINHWEKIDCYWEDQNGIAQPFKFSITRKLYHPIQKQIKELAW